MISVMDELEKMTPSAEEEEEIENEEAESEEEGGEDDGKDEEDEDGEEQEGKDDMEKEEEAMPHAVDKSEENNPSPVKPKEKKQPEGLNLNNEVVRMRKEVKRVRALIIRKLTRQIGALKKKKGKETELERNQRRAARLLEEIHAMKVLSPDLVTKTALQKTLNFDQECKNPKSTISSRAIARIGTHPQFNKKIEAIKDAVKAFKEERMKGGDLEKKEKVQNKAGKAPQSLQSPDKKRERERESEKEEVDVTVEEREIIENEEGDGILEDAADPTAEPEKETEKATPSIDSQRKEIPESKNVTPASNIKSSEVKDVLKNRPQSKAAEKKPELKSAPEVLQKKKDEEESDLESSDDEEKEYFDDSTEERFHKQSSQSEESDDDDFFVGKVSKFKKKKKQKSVEGEKAHVVKAEPTDEFQSKLDELESRLKSKTSLQSVFCSSLSASKPGGGRGAGRGRGGDNFRGQERRRGGPNRDFSKQSKFQKQEKGAERNSGSNFSKSESSETGFPSVGRGRGRGRGDFMRQKDRRGGGVFTHQAPEQALHPSWEASKKRKEQQGQILAFQGKKIKFDDDD